MKNLETTPHTIINYILIARSKQAKNFFFGGGNKGL